jgi:hypothetical protein
MCVRKKSLRYLENLGLLEELPLAGRLLFKDGPGGQHTVALLCNGGAVRVSGGHQAARRLAQGIGPLLLGRQRRCEVVVALHEGLDVLEILANGDVLEELGRGGCRGVDLIRLAVEQLKVSHLKQRR